MFIVDQKYRTKNNSKVVFVGVDEGLCAFEVLEGGHNDMDFGGANASTHRRYFTYSNGRYSGHRAIEDENIHGMDVVELWDFLEIEKMRAEGVLFV